MSFFESVNKPTVRLNKPQLFQALPSALSPLFFLLQLFFLPAIWGVSNQSWNKSQPCLVCFLIANEFYFIYIFVDSNKKIKMLQFFQPNYFNMRQKMAFNPFHLLVSKQQGAAPLMNKAKTYIASFPRYELAIKVLYKLFHSVIDQIISR